MPALINLLKYLRYWNAKISYTKDDKIITPAKLTDEELTKIYRDLSITEINITVKI